MPTYTPPTQTLLVGSHWDVVVVVVGAIKTAVDHLIGAAMLYREAQLQMVRHKVIPARRGYSLNLILKHVRERRRNKS